MDDRRPAGCLRINPLKAELGQIELVDKHVDTRTGLSSSIQSSRHSGNSVLCPRSTPSTKRFIQSPTAPESLLSSILIKQPVFTQPGSLTDVGPNERHVRLCFASGPPTDVARRVNQRDMRRHIFSWRPVR